MKEKPTKTRGKTKDTSMLSADLRNYLDLLQERVLVIDMQGNFLFANKAARIDLGENYQQTHVLQWSQQYAIRDANTLQAITTSELPIIQVLKGASEVERELCLSLNGTDIYVRVHARPHFNEEQRLVGCIATYSNITLEVEQRRTISQNLNQMRILMERMNEGVIQMDLAGNVLYANLVMCRLLGTKRQQLINKHISAAITLIGESQNKFAELLKDLAAGVSGRYELSINTTSGELKILEVSVAPIRNEQGVITSMLNLHTDITERRLANNQLRQSEARYRSLVEHMNEGVVLLDHTGQIRFANASFCKLTGHNLKALIGKHYVDLFKVDNLAHKPGEYDLPIEHTNGSTRWHHISAVKYQAEKNHPPGLMLIHSDKTAEKKLAEERERLLITAESTTDFVAIVAIDGRVLYINKAGRKAVGISLKYPVEKVVMDDYYTPNSLKILYTVAVPYAIKHGAWQGEMGVMGSNKRVIPISQVIISKKNANGKVEYFASIGRDMSESKNLQREMAILARMPHEQPTPVMRIARNGTITYANPASDMLLKDWKTRAGKKVPAIWQRTITNILRTGYYKEFEVACGKKIFDLKLVPVPEYDYVNLIGNDITHSKKAEEQLKASERTYKAVLEDQTELISRYLANGTITFANGAYCRYFNHDAATIVGKNLFSFVPSQKLSEFKKRLSQLSKSNPSITYSQEIKDGNNPSRWQMWTDRAIFDENDNFVEYQSVALDITTLKATELELRTQEVYLRQIIDAIPNLVYARDAEGRYKLVNQALADFFGTDVKSIIDRKHQDLMPSEDVKAFLEQDHTIITDKSATRFPEEMVTRPADGAQLWFSTVKKPLFSDDGKAQILGVSTDITERKLVEQSLKVQLRLKEMISNIAKRFINLPYHQIDDAIQECLETLGELNDVDRVVINLKANKEFKPKYYWLRHNHKLARELVQMAHPFNTETWEADQLKQKGYLYLPNVETIPEGTYLKDLVQKAAIKSSIILPLQSKGEVTGVMSLTSTEKQLTWSEDVIALLRITSQIISSALERKNTEALLNFTLQFENIITIISANFINIDAKNINSEITSSLQYVAEFLGVDQSYIFMANTTGRRFKLLHHWLENDLEPDSKLREQVEGQKYVWIFRQVKKYGIVTIPSVADLPDDAVEMKKVFVAGGIKAMLGVPIMSKGDFRGILVFASFKQENFWQNEAIPLLKIFSQIIANALERKHNEEEIAETRELYRTLARNIPKAAVFLYDHDLRYRLVEGAELENQGYDKNTMEGRVINQVLPPPALKILEPLYRDALKGKEHVMEREFNKKQYLIHFLPVRNEHDEIYAGMVMSLDISDLKEIQRKLEYRTSELLRSNEDLELFAYAASHDLQEPLRMISSYMHLIQRRLNGNLEPDVLDFMNFAVDGVKRMQELINDLLEYSRVDRKGDSFKLIDLNKTVDFVKINLQQVIQEKGATIHVENLPTVLADQSQMVSLMQNLIENAIKFKRQEPSVVYIGSSEEKDKYKFFVRDNGIGIDKKYFDRIFIIFQRLNSRSEYAGTGIGLAICKKIIERHGGKLWVESELGSGATFYFELKKTQA